MENYEIKTEILSLEPTENIPVLSEVVPLTIKEEYNEEKESTDKISEHSAVKEESYNSPDFTCTEQRVNVPIRKTNLVIEMKEETQEEIIIKCEIEQMDDNFQVYFYYYSKQPP